MSYKIISKFIKDVSFEIPTPQAYVMLEKEIANYKLNFDIKSNKFKDNIIEVNTTLRIIPNYEVKHIVLAEITCSALVSIEKNFENKEELEKIILINIPSEVYSTLYDTFVYLFNQSGIKNIQIDKKVDFEKLYKEKK
tara:strand:+ start:134 stop:547 length:414 start_codon:yes stop_codon:yes gene_type:complete